MKKKLLALALYLIPFVSYSQYWQYPQNPSSIHWKQIKTEHFIIIFPSDISARGMETARLLEHVYMPVSQSLNKFPKRIPLFLFNQSVISNGFTALAPRYVGFYTTPPQDATLVGGADWLQSLATHEYRHVVQYSNFDKNFTNFMGNVMGDYGKVFMMNWSVPQWFFEGDAVCTETILSKDGRGRMPFFTRDIRAMELENIRYSYDKAYLGSYRNYSPDYYHLGYLLTAYVTKNFGAEAWGNTMYRSTKFSFWPFSFTGSLRKYTHASIRRNYKNALNEFKSIWTSKIEDYPVTDFKKVNLTVKKVWTSYSFPFYISDESFIALKKSLDNPPTLILISKEKEKKLTELNPVDRIHSNGRLVVWSSETSDLRWGQRSYSDIMKYDLQTYSKKKLTRKGKFFAPAISPDGSQVAAIEYNSHMNCSLVILDALNGKVQNKYSIPDSNFIRMPSWSEDGKNIVFTQTYSQLKTISVLTLENGTIRNIIPYGTENISNPVFYNNFILYNSPYTGIDALLAVNIEDGTRYIVATGKYGIYNPTVSPNKREIAVENYTTSGFDIDVFKSDPNAWMPANHFENVHDNYYKYLIELENTNNIFDSTSLRNPVNYEIKNYKPLLHAITIHSWMPYPVNNGIGMQIFSNDRLNTTALTAGINYFPDEAASREFLILSYAKLFPVFDFELSYGRDYTTLNIDGNNVLAKMNEKLAKVKISLPFNFSKGIYSTTLIVSSGYDFIMNQYPGYINTFNNKDYTVTSAIESRLAFSNMKQMALRDINPKFGQKLDVNYWNSPFENAPYGDRFNTSATIYFPGFFKNHSISLSGGYEYSSNDSIGGIYLLTTELEFVRGYTRVNYDRFVNGTLVYSMPLFYPDLPIGPVLYLKRVRSNFFYDYGWVTNDNKITPYNSTGLDLNVEFNFFRIPIPFEMGVRYSYRITDNKNAFEFLFFGVAF